MRDFILNFPNQFEKGIKSAEVADIDFYGKKFTNLVICGMGGSALPGELIKILPELNIPVFIHKSYGLPREASGESLVLISSYSGDTEETISVFHESLQRKLSIIAFSDYEGKIQEIAKENNIFSVRFPKEAENFQPRFSLGYSFSAMIYCLSRLGMVHCNVSTILSEVRNFLNKENSNFEEYGKQLAKEIYEKIILIYAPHDFRGLSYIWKINFNETSKVLAFSNCFPELNHNEINGFVNFSKIAGNKIKILSLLDDNTDERIIRQSQITTELLFKQGIETINISLYGKNTLQKIFSSVLLSMWTSYYLALLYNTDPIPVKIVEELKKELAK